MVSILEPFGTKENTMATLKDLVKAALEKKQAEQAQVKKGQKLDASGAVVKDQVSSHKPAKKSAGRGR